VHTFIISIELQPGPRDEALARARTAQARAEPGWLAYDFFTCTDDPDRPVLVESWTSKEAHDRHLQAQHTREWIAVHEPKHRGFLFETIDAAP
jgi:quinol monooxygenase YgiN